MNAEQTLWARRFKWISILEGISFLLLLFIAMPLKYIYDIPQAVTYVGWAHGLLFILYIYVVFPTAQKLKWEFGRTFLHCLPLSYPLGLLFSTET